MCGICGLVGLENRQPISLEGLLAMRDVLEHRGPDDAGHYLGPHVALGSRRLAILDLSERGHMPMTTPDGRYTIVYNGEVYNYRDIRPSLEACGREFVSNTDTEVLLNLYAVHGPGMLDCLNGMFAFAVWDNVEKSLFLARDRLGIKPLYYAVQNGKLYFASEEKALFEAGVTPRFDYSTLEELLCFRYTAGERTPFEGVKRLLPGHYLVWKDGRIETRRWWNLARRVADVAAAPAADALQWYEEVFRNAVDLRRISDVPIGVLLSGGLDSSSVAAAIAGTGASDVASFTVRFEEAEYDEGPLAKQVAEHFGLDYHELMVSPSDLLPRLERASWLHDEPLIHASSLHILAISEYAKPRVTVLLSGEGSDETLGGYVRYRPLRYQTLLSATRPVIPWAANKLNATGRLAKLGRFCALGTLERFVLYNSCDTLPSDLLQMGMEPLEDYGYRQDVLEEAMNLYPGDRVRQAMYSDQHTFLCSILDRNDRMTMGASIECRVPFLDYRLVEGVAALPSRILLGGHKTKRLVRETLGTRLPPTILKHRKWGFGVPWNRHLREVRPLRELVCSLPDMEPFRDGPLNGSRMRDLLAQFMNGDPRNEELVRQMTMIGVWHQAVFSRPRADQKSVR